MSIAQLRRLADEPGDRSGVRRSNIPGGWIVYDISSDAFRCGGAKNDVWSIVRFDNLLVNAVLSVCASSPTPTNWSDVGFMTDFIKCGNTGAAKDNVKEIRRIN